MKHFGCCLDAMNLGDYKQIFDLKNDKSRIFYLFFHLSSFTDSITVFLMNVFCSCTTEVQSYSLTALFVCNKVCC